jgi:hypothetical protein
VTFAAGAAGRPSRKSARRLVKTAVGWSVLTQPNRCSAFSSDDPSMTWASGAMSYPAAKPMIRCAACWIGMPGSPTAWHELARRVKPPALRSVHSPSGSCHASQPGNACRCTSWAEIRRGCGPPAAAGARRAAMIMDRSITRAVGSRVASCTDVGCRPTIQPMTSVAEPSGNQYLTTQRSPERAATSGSLLRPVNGPAFLDGPR